jgi:hypothetical protein
MYDYDGGDENHEWIEIFSPDCINLTEWKFYEAETNHRIYFYSGQEKLCNNYAIIADDAEQFLIDYQNFSGNLFDTSFQSLSNSGETLAMKNPNNEIIEEITYQNIFANGDGYTLERKAGNWFASTILGGTPGSGNNNIQIENPIKEEPKEPIPEPEIIVQQAEINPIIEEVIDEKIIENKTIPEKPPQVIEEPIINTPTGNMAIKTESDGFSLSLDIDPIEIIKSFFRGIWETIQNSIDKSFAPVNNTTE